VPEEVVSAMIQLVSSQASLQVYGTKQLFNCAQSDAGNAQPLLQIAFWCIGEFGDLLVTSSDNSASVRFLLKTFLSNRKNFLDRRKQCDHIV
jgi:AP-1 complex subunit gamma-1